ncbi:MAG: SlyX family protein [Myxococcales bacterium]|nr:SlyX family protein [Myxococcales bacterium]
MSELRLTELEMSHAHLEKTVAELSEVVWRQQQQLDALKELFGSLKERLAAEPGLVDAGRQDKPPHY